MADEPSSLTPVTRPGNNLHWAVSSGDFLQVERLLTASNVNLADSNGRSPLLLAECIKDEASYEKIVRILIDSGADVSVCNNTPLRSAVFYQKRHLVELLLQKGAEVIDSNLLHIAVSNGDEEILALLLADMRCQEIIDGPDGAGRTPAFLAAHLDRKGCLRMLIAKGANLSLANFQGETVMDSVFEDMARPGQFMIDVFNLSVVLERNEEKNRYYVDFRVLAPGNTPRQMAVISSLLVAANEEEKTEVLQHPLIELYLTLKWAKACYFFYLWIGAYIVFVLSLSVHVLLLLHGSEKNIGFLVSRWILILSATCLLGHGILQCCLTHGNYHQKYEMWLNLACTCLSLIVAIAEKFSTTLQAQPSWILHITSIAVLLSWTELMLLIGRLPTFGYYAHMFSAVLQNVIRVIAAFLCLIIGFALSFSIQFANVSDFNDPWRALVKTTVMMMGEFDYGDLFVDKAAASRVIFLMFIILTAIVLMNLMVGLAVSDIQCLQMVSHARKLEKQADFLSQLEKVLSSRKFLKKLLKRNHIDTRYALETSAKFRRKKKLSSRLIDALVGIAKSRREKCDFNG